MITERLILDMGIILAVAMLFGAVLEKYKFPSVLGYILAGMVIGPITGLVHSNEMIDLFSEVGVIMLLFYIGLELDPDKLKEGGLAAFILEPLKMVVNFVLGFAIGRVFGLDFMESSFLGMIIMMSSTAVIGKYLMDKGEMKTMHASIAITMLLIEDFVAILILAVLGSMHGGREITSVIMTSVAVVLVFLMVISDYSKYMINFIERFEYKKHIALYSLGIAFFLSYLVSFFGLSPAIGAFLAGYLFSRVGHHKEIEGQLGMFREFFSAFFFVSIGMLFTIPTGISAYIIIALLIIATLVGNYLSYGAFGTFLGIDAELVSNLSALMIPIGEFSLIIATYAVKLKLPHASLILNSAIFLGLATTFIMPYGLRYTDKTAKLLDKIPKSARLSLAGILIHATKTSADMRETTISFFKSLGVYLVAGFSVVYLLVVAGSRIKFSLFGYPSGTVMEWLAAVLLIPVIYGIVLKIKWLGMRLVEIAGNTIFPDLKDYHIKWMQSYLGDMLAGLSLVILAVGLGSLAIEVSPAYLVFPALILIIGMYYAVKGYLTSIGSYEKIKKGIKVREKMRWVGGRIR